MLSYADKVKKKKKKSSSFADSVINGTYETAFSRKNVSQASYKETKVKPSNNTKRLQTTTLTGDSQFKTTSSSNLLGGDNIPFKSTLSYTPKDDIAPVKTTKKEEKPWYKKFFEGSEAFKDGYDAGDITKTILGTGTDIENKMAKGVLSIVEAPVDIASYGGYALLDMLGADENAQKVKKFAQRDLSKEFADKYTKSSSMLGNAYNVTNKTQEDYQKVKELYEQGDIEAARKETKNMLKDSGKGLFTLITGGSLDQITKEVGMTLDKEKLVEEVESDSVSGDTLDKTAELIGYVLSMGGTTKVLDKATGTVTKGITTKAGTTALGTTLSGGNVGITVAGKTLNLPTTALMGGMSGGLNEAYQKEGVTHAQAWTKGLTSGAIEGVTEGLFGMLGVGGNELTDQVASKLAKQFTSSSGKQVANILAKGGGEAFEELSSYTLNWLTDNNVIDKMEGADFKSEFDWEEVSEQMALAIISTGAMQGSGTALEVNAQVNNIINQTEQELGRSLTKAEKKSIRSEATQKIIDLQNNQVSTEENIPIQNQENKVIDEAELRRQNLVYEANENDSDIKRTLYQSASEVMNNTTRSREFVEVVSKIAEKTGTKYKFTNTEQLNAQGYGVEGKTVNGLVNENGEVLINIDSAKALNSIVGHETTHLFEANETEFKELKEFAKKYAITKQDYDARIQDTTKLYEGTNANIENEVTADIIGDYLFTDQEFINSLAVEKPTFFQKIYNEVKHWIKMATAGSKEARQLEQLKHSFEKALNKQSEIKTKPTTTQQTESNLATEVESNTQEKEEVVQKVEEIAPIEETIKEETVKEEIKELAKEKPIKETTEKNTTTPTQEELDNLENVRLNKSGSEYALEFFRLRDKYGQTNLYKGLNNYKATGKALDTKTFISDSKGKTLTKEQQEYFKDSKVRDENGNLLTMYHGTSSGGHTVFDPYGGKPGLFGQGSYFTADNTVAESYTQKGRGNNKQIYEVYLNITNPIDMDAQANVDEWKQYFSKHLPDADFPKSGTNEALYRSTLEEFENSEYDRYEVAEIMMDTFQKMGYDGITHIGGGRFNQKDDTRHRVFITFDSNQIKNADNTTPTSDADIRYSLSENGTLQDSNGNDVKLDTSETGTHGTLMAIHNLNESKMKGILELGGFPVPSIAVMNPSTTGLSYGDISVLFDKNTIDPSNKSNEVYGSDVYSPRFPQTVQKINEKELSKLENYLGKNLYLEDTTLDETVQKNRYTKEFIDKFAKENNITVENVYKDNGFNYTFSTDENVKKFIIENDITFEKLLNDTELRNKFYELYRESSTGILKGLTERKIETFEKAFADNNVNIGSRLDSDFNSIKNGSERVLDEFATEKALRDKVLDQYESQYTKFLTDKLAPVFENKYIRNNKELFTPSGNRRSFKQLYNEYTLDNVVKEMKGKVRGEEGFFYGSGNIRSQVTPQFKSIADIKANESKLVTNSKMEIVKQDIDSDLNNLSVTAKNFGGYSYDSYETALNEIAGLKKITPTKVKEILGDYGFENVPDILVDKSIEFLEKLKNAPTEYFEAKPQRAVGLDEVQAIVIPNTTDADFKQQLQDAGLKYYEYDPNIEGDKQRVINQFDELKFSLSNQNEDIAPIGNYNVYGEEVKLQQEETKKQVEEAVAPLEEKIDALTKQLTELEENMAPVSQEIVEKAGQQDSKTLTEKDMPTTEGTFNFNDEEVNIKNKNDIVADIKDNFNIKRDEARELYNKIANTEFSTVEEVYNELENYRKINIEEESDYKKDIKNLIRKTRINTSDIKDQITDYNDFRKANFGKLRLTKDGMPVDSVYQELNEMYPSEFPSDITNPADQLEYIADYVNQDTTSTMSYELDDDDLYDLAEKLYVEIGNKERYSISQEQFKQTTRDLKNMEAPVENVSNTDEIAPVNTNTLETTNEAENVENEANIQRDPLLEFLQAEMDRQENKAKEKEAAKKNKTAKVKPREKGRIRTAIDTGKQLFVNKNVEIDNLARESGNKNIKFAGDMLNSVAGEVESNISAAQTDNQGKAIGKSINQLFSNAKSEGLYDAFNDYLIHYSNIDRHQQGKGSVVPLSESQQLVQDYEKSYPEFKEWSKDVWKFGENARNSLLEAGLIEQKTADLLADMYPHYVPYIEDREIANYFGDYGEIKAKGVLKRAKGGANEVLPVEEALAKYTYAYKKAVRQNELYREIVSTLKNDKVSIGADTRTEVTDLSESLYRDENGNYLTAYVNGKQQSVRISDSLYNGLKNDLETTVKDLEKKFEIITSPLQKASEIRRNLLTTWSPTFIITNPIKDIQDAVLNSKYTKDFLKNYPVAFKELAQGKSELVQQFMSLYGSGNTMGDFDVDSGLSKGISANQKNKNFLSRISQVNEIMELAPRYAEFKASIENGTSVQEAMYNARDITTNFNRGGVITKALNRNGFTFLNASVQGFSKLIRNFSGENGAKGVVSSLVKAVMFGVAPALFNHLAFGGDDEEKDEEYEALPDYIKDNYYIIKTGEGEFIRIPKGRMISIFGSAGRRTLEYLEGEEDAFDGYFTNAYSQVGIQNPSESNIFAPLLQAYGSENGEAWYGGDLVPTRLQDKPVAEQYDETTDEFSKWLGEKLNISPYKLNYVLDQYTGGIGDMVLPTITEEASSDSDSVIGTALAPLRDKFTADSTTDNKYVSDFYTKNEELTVTANGSNATDEDILKQKYMYSVSKKMSELYKEKREVQANKDLSKSEKYNKSKAIKDEINKLAKEGLDNYQNLNKTSNYAMVGDQEYYLNAKGSWSSPSEEELETINAFGLDIDEKSSYFNAKNEIYNINNSYRETLEFASEDEKDLLYAQKKVEIIDTIKNTGLNDFGKAYLYDKQYGDTDTLNTVISLDIDMDSYLDLEAQSFTADRYSNGKTIPNSKKNKVFNYINSMNIPYEQKMLLAKMKYNSYDDNNYEIIEYVNDNPYLEYEDRVVIFKQLGFTVYDDGTITWK